VDEGFYIGLVYPQV